jgi:hypothetical protein
MLEYLPVQPAYGRVYPTKEAMVQGFIDGRDFSPSIGGPYLSIRDFVKNEPALTSYGGVTLVQRRAKRELCFNVTIAREAMVWPKLFPEDEGEPDHRYTNQDSPHDFLVKVVKNALGQR